MVRDGSLFKNYLNCNVQLSISCRLPTRINMLKILKYIKPYAFSKICKNMQHIYLYFDCDQ